MSSALISCDSVSCTYFVRKTRLRTRPVHALVDISLDLHEGETIGIIGHNGAGKSTLLQIFSRILQPNSGRIVFRENLIVSLLTLQQGFSQELTGRQNAILGAMYLGFTRKEAQAKLEKILDFAEIGHWADEPLRTYSSGMKGRLGFAVAMEMRADVMLIDESMGTGDAYFQQKSKKALLEKIKSGQSNVIVSHSAGILKQLCSRIVWLHKGTIKQIGTPEQTLPQYTVWVEQLQRETAGAK